MRRFVLMMLVCMGCHMAAAQQRNNSIYFEAGGAGMLYSAGYERMLWSRAAFRAGVSFLSINEMGTGKNLCAGTLPAGVYWLQDISRGMHYAEAGAGVNAVLLSSTMNSYVRENDIYLNPFLSIGYRFHSGDGRWILRASFTPFYGTRPLNDRRVLQNGFSVTGAGFQLWGGIGVGYRF